VFTLSGRSRRRLGAGELRQGGLLGGRRVEREEVVRRLISCIHSPHARTSCLRPTTNRSTEQEEEADRQKKAARRRPNRAYLGAPWRRITPRTGVEARRNSPRCLVMERWEREGARVVGAGPGRSEMCERERRRRDLCSKATPPFPFCEKQRGLVIRRLSPTRLSLSPTPLP
jgi:hypothetical protein